MPYTSKEVAKLKYTGTNRRVRVSDNLYINLTHKRKTWLYRSTLDGKTTSKTIGLFEHFTFKQAKDAAYQLKFSKPELPKHKFSELSEDYLAESEHVQIDVLRNRMAIINKRFGTVDISDITKLDIVNFIRAYRIKSASMASQLLIHIRMALSHGVGLGWIEENAAVGIPRSATGYAPRVVTRTLSDGEIKWLFQQENSNARVLRFQLLTGLRITEVLTGEIDGDKFRCIAKGGTEHWVYLTLTARMQLPLPQGRVSSVVNTWLRRKGHDWRSHDVRRTYSTIANSEGVPAPIVEKVLNHKLYAMQAVYNFAQYEPERRHCAEVVEAYILKALDGLPEWLG